MNQDTASNVYDFPAREYGIQGRWPSPDPSGLAAVDSSDPQSWNRYAYVGNSPLNLTDPLGLTTDPGCAAISHGRIPACHSGIDEPDDSGGDGGCTVDGAPNQSCSEESSEGGVNLSSILVYLVGGTPFVTDDINAIITDPTNPPLAFDADDEVILDPSGDDVLVGVYFNIPNANTPWMFSASLPVLPIVVPTEPVPLPIGDVAVNFNITYIPKTSASKGQMCGATGVGVQIPPGASSFAVGPLLSGDVQNTAQVVSGASESVSVSAVVGYQWTHSSSGNVAGWILSNEPGVSGGVTAGSCATIP